MSYSNSFPQQRPTLNLDFANSGKLDSRVSYSRSSSGSFLSNEKALNSENLLKNSQDYSAVWANMYIAAPAGSQTAPDGSSTAFKLTATSEASAAPTIYQAGISLSATTHTAVVHLKAGTASHGFISIRTSSGNSAYAMVNFSAGTVSNGHFGTVTNSSSTIAALGSNWFKITLTATTATTSTGFIFIGSSDGTAPDGSGYPMWTTAGQTIFVWGAQLSTVGNKVYDSPTTTQISREYAPLLKEASADSPRFEFAADGQSVGTALGLLVESQSTNKATYSEDFTNAVYNKYRATIESASAIAPDGTLTASFLREDATASNTHYLNAVTATGLSVGTTKYAVSIFVKSAGRSKIKIYDNNQNTSGSTTFDLSSGTVVTGGGSIQSCGNGWYRCTIIPTCNYSATSSVYISLDNGSGTSYNGDSYSGILVWGYQLETGVSASSSYIKSNSGSGTTRSADSCSVDLSSFYSGGPTSIVIETPAGAGAGYIPYLFSLAGGDQNFYAFKNTTTASASDDWRYQVGGTGTTVSGSAGSDKVAIRWDTADVKAQFSAGVSSTNSGAVETAFTTLKIGMSPANLYQLNGNFKRVSLFNVALSDTELAALVD